MSEGRKYTFEHYPADKLPDDLRADLGDAATVKVTVEVDGGVADSSQRTMVSYIGSAKGVFKTPEEALEHIRALRDEWDD